MTARPAWVGLGLPVEEAAESVSCSTDGVNDHLRRELAARGGESTTLRLTSEAAASVDAYIEYRRIVGDADGGVLFSGTSLVSATRWKPRALLVRWRSAVACCARRVCVL